MKFYFLFITLFSIFAICLPISAQHPDAVGIWLFDEGTGDEAADSSGNEHTASVVGGKLEWVDGKIGKAVGFKPGIYLEVEHTDTFNLKTFTVAAWIKFLSDTGGGEQNIAYKQVGNDRLTRNYTLKMWGGKIYGIFASDGNTDAVELESATNVVDKKWHHVAITYDKKAFKLYVNGKEENSGDYVKDPETNDAPLRIGNGIDGIIDELQILSVALSADEIQSDMNNGIQLPVEPTGKVTTTWGKLKAQW